MLKHIIYLCINIYTFYLKTFIKITIKLTYT